MAQGVCLGMDISVGALQHEEKKVKKVVKAERLSFEGSEFFHGIHPQWKSLEEKYFEKWEKKQIKYKKRLREIARRRKKDNVGIHQYSHNMLMCFTGPEWYQELSPQQKEIIDNLRNTMKKDLDSHLTKATRSCLSLLGMRPLPNDSQLWRALTKSFGCPVQFLLELYQLIQPHLKFYSINDRLLLSGVAHLCLRDTLREMHVRSPSPPKIEKPPPAPKPKQKKKRYDSVYLVPFTYQWPQRKSDKYKNPSIQRPTCPYFSYICDYEPVRLRTFDDLHQDGRIDDDVKVPCELFEDHLVAEDYFNLLFKPPDSTKYILVRPKQYETTVPKTYPGILPKFMQHKQNPPRYKLHFDVKIYDELNPINQKKRKVIRTICEVRPLSWGRPGQLHTLVAKYVHIMNIGEYIAQKGKLDELFEEGGDYPCSVCGGPEGKENLPEVKSIKQKSWIKRIRPKKKKREIVHTNLSDFMDLNRKRPEMARLDREAKKLIEENKRYIESWNYLFANIARLEKLRLETKTCVCPGRTRDKSKFDPEMDCTCAVWNIPTPPKSTTLKEPCECAPTEDEYIYEPAEEDKCDCKKKAREKALEKCAKCGQPREKTKEELEARGACECTRILDACGNCVKQPPLKFPLLEGETEKECECNAEAPKGEKDMTVAYVFVDNKLPNQSSNESKGTECSCRHSLQSQARDGKAAKMKQKNKNDTRKAKKKSDIGVVQSNKEEIKCSVERGKILEFDRCRRETEKLLNSLKCECPKCKDIRRKYRASYIQAGTRDGCGGLLPVIGGVHGAETECDCLEKFEERVKSVKDYKDRLKAKVDLKNQEHKYVISGVHQTLQGPIYNLGGVISPKPCICDTEEEILAEKQKGEKLSTSLKPGFKHIIAGVRGGSQSREYIIGGAIKECECAEVYEKFTKEHNECLVNYERYLNYMEKEVQEYMKDMQERYKDPFVTVQKLIGKEKKKMTGAPGLPLPDGKSEFLISGVQASQVGKNFILGGLPRRDSDELTVAVETYTHNPDTEGKSSTKCQRIFLCNYMTFGKNCGNPFAPKKDIYIKNSSEEVLCRCISYERIESEESEEEEEEEDDGCACECPCGVEIKKPDDCSCAIPKKPSEESCFCADIEEEEEEEIKTPDGCTCGYIEPESSGSASDPCLCHLKNCGCQVGNVCVKECFYGPMEAWWTSSDRLAMEKDQKEEIKDTPSEDRLSELVSTYGGPSKRYVILRKLPTMAKFQRQLIQKLLRSLANDGYPLAQLPECHRLPYFWLWMQFRIRKTWNHNDAVKNLERCQTLWSHISLCKRNIPFPKLPVHCHCEAVNQTWDDADKVKKIVRDTKQKFYNEVRKNMVDYAREFYSTISAYQYPNPRYLNHYFYAYQPAKVENVLAEYVWAGHEHKDPKDYKSCLCK